MATRHNLDSEDDGTSTQSVTSCCSDLDQKNDEQLEEPMQIHTSCDNIDVTWSNASDQAQSIDHLFLKVDIDTLISKAIFRLTCRVWIKGKGKNRTQLKGDQQPVFLFIHPENIRAITLGADDDKPSLRFCMDQDGSRLVIPSDCILECKNSVHARLLSMRALANASDFTIHLKNADTSKFTRHHLQQIASIFSVANTSRPGTDDRRTNLQTLYIGVGGHVFDTSMPLVDNASSKDTSAPPSIDYEPYRERKPPRKRKRERERERDSSDYDYDHSSRSLKGLVEHLLDMENRLRNDMRVMTESLGNRIRNDMKDAIEASENRLRDDMKDMIESSEDRSRNHVEDVVEATGSRLKDELNDMLDSRADEVDCRIDGSMDDLRTECIGTIESEFRYLKYGIEEVTKGMEEAEEKAKGVLAVLDEVGDGIERRVGRYLNGIRLQVTVEDE
ncbi:hypothetical protein MKX08_007119 [Trichoderma sp. CBMAI-0020]|nr:hypothetical protein MKX08_007119 [Trichoderma sp. CBMAI-0020]